MEHTEEHAKPVLTNGIHKAAIEVLGSDGAPSIEQLEAELPFVGEGQIPLGEVVTRVVSAIYDDLVVMRDILGNHSSDTARKRTIADWVVRTKKQAVKLYAVVKWSRDAETVQKCMNITSFILAQSEQFETSIQFLYNARDSLDQARMRNHDLLTALDVLTTGSYQRLPTVIKKSVIAPPPLTNAEVFKTVSNLEEVMRFRLRMDEVIPVEMTTYTISEGRVHFAVPKLFQAALSLKGAEKYDGWFFVDVEFLFNIGGESGVQEFPRKPKGIMRRHIADEADGRLGFYVAPPEQAAPQPTPAPEKPKLRPGVTDAPLVRLYNFLQMMSLSYQLEILWYQAERLRSLGWGEYFSVRMSADRKIMTASYWVRPQSSQPVQTFINRPQFPAFAGNLKISLVPASTQPPGPIASKSVHAAFRSETTPKNRVLTDLQQAAKLDGNKPSDEVERLKFRVQWETSKGAFGISFIPPEELYLDESVLKVDSECLDFEALLHKVIQRHTRALLMAFQIQLQRSPTSNIFSKPGVVDLVGDGHSLCLHVRLCASETVIVSIDSRTGRLTLRDIGDLAAADRGPKYLANSEKLNDNPTLLLTMLMRFRLRAIMEIAQQKATYLGLQSFITRNFQQNEFAKLGPSTRSTLYIQLTNAPNNYLVVVATDEQFRYALISCRPQPESPFANLVMEDIGWLEFERIHETNDIVVRQLGSSDEVQVGMKRSHDELSRDPSSSGTSGFVLETQVLRELYSYCCARVAYMKVEQQFKLRGIPFMHVNPTFTTPLSPDLVHIQSSLARSVPALCVASQHILSGAPAAEAAMPNIRVIPLNWWSEKKAQVVTCVKLKYVQQPMGKTASRSSNAVIRPSKRIIYDTREAVVSFLSENVDTCVDEFLEEWARVSKMVVIAREVGQMSKEKDLLDVRLLSFDLQTVEFIYAEDYMVSISYEDDHSMSITGGNFHLRFSRSRKRFLGSLDMDQDQDTVNPHDEAEHFLRSILKHGQGRLASSVNRLVGLLRDTLPIVEELDKIKKERNQRPDRTPKNIVDTFPKAAGWYRLLYGDMRHALDFRLMSDRRVAIMDASHSLFALPQSDQDTVSSSDDSLGLKPIPGVQDVMTGVIRNVVQSGKVRPGTIAFVDVGLICRVNDVRTVAKTVHTMLSEKLDI